MAGPKPHVTASGGPYKHKGHAKAAAKRIYGENEAAYTIVKDHNGFWWSPLRDQVRDRGVTSMNQMIIKANTEPLRTITRTERRRIMDALDEHYDLDKQRYFKAMSDQKLAEKLNLPRAWLTQIRVELYGDHDRNEEQEADKAKALENIRLAEKTRDQLLEMASKAETILNELKQKAGVA
jgi:hypothetical protein